MCVSDELERQEKKGWAPTSLGTCNDVVTLKNSREAVCLDRCWNVVLCEFHIAQHDWMQASILEGDDRIDSNGSLLDNLNFSNADKVSSCLFRSQEVEVKACKGRTRDC
jgi:hypothetical protein